MSWRYIPFLLVFGCFKGCNWDDVLELSGSERKVRPILTCNTANLGDQDHLMEVCLSERNVYPIGLETEIIQGRGVALNISIEPSDGADVAQTSNWVYLLERNSKCCLKCSFAHLATILAPFAHSISVYYLYLGMCSALGYMKGKPDQSKETHRAAGPKQLRPSLHHPPSPRPPLPTCSSSLLQTQASPLSLLSSSSSSSLTAHNPAPTAVVNKKKILKTGTICSAKCPHPNNQYLHFLF